MRNGHKLKGRRTPAVHVLLFEPEIPPNTGNIMRLCANAGARLHLVGELGFELDDRRLRRAGLDYREWADVRRHPDIRTACEADDIRRLYAFTTRGQTDYTSVRFEPGDGLLFGPETRGLPADVLEAIGDDCLRIPMQAESRSMNLSNAVAIGLYEALRQLGFPELA